MLLIREKSLDTPFCRYPFQKLKICSNGDVNFCCFQRDGTCIDNILEVSLERIWNSRLAKDVRYATSNGELHKFCQQEGCPFYHRKDKLAGVHDPDAVFTKFPIDIELDLPMQHCNIGGLDPKAGTVCIMCERATRFEKQEDRVDEICDVLRPYAKHIRFLHIQGIAESFWKDRIFEVVDRIGIDVQKTRITTYTNGTILGGERLTKWLKYPWTCTTFSIDAAKPETYKKIRIWDAYERIIANMTELSRRRCHPYQSLQIHNNINMLNINEVEGMVEIAAQVKADYLSFNPTHHFGDNEVSNNNVHLFKEAQTKIIKRAAQINVNVGFIRDFGLDLVPLVQISL